MLSSPPPWFQLALNGSLDAAALRDTSQGQADSLVMASGAQAAVQVDASGAGQQIGWAAEATIRIEEQSKQAGGVQPARHAQACDRRPPPSCVQASFMSAMQRSWRAAQPQTASCTL